MKQYLLTLLSLLLFTSAFSQTTENITLDAAYANQVYYSLENGIVKTSPLASWDLAFDVSGFGSVIKFNGATGSELTLYPKGNASGWNTIDTAGISEWKLLYDSDKSWGESAFNRNTASETDLGWGTYSTITHVVSGDSIYIAKLSDGSYRKLLIERLQSGTFHVAYARLDGTDSVHFELKKSDYPDRNFAYYSLLNDEQLDLEPDNSSWDLIFTKYIGELAPGVPYGVTGVLSNAGVKSLQINDVHADEASSDGLKFSEEINIIGYDWKTFNMSTFSYDITDSLVYFVEDKNEETWKVILTDFTGSSTGEVSFTKEKLDNTTGVLSDLNPNTSFELYPNPAIQSSQVRLNLTDSGNPAFIQISNLQGHVVETVELTDSEIVLPPLPSGTYAIQLINASSKQVQLLTIY